MIEDNKIKIPWYRRNVKSQSFEESVPFSLAPDLTLRPKPSGAEPPRQPVRELVPETEPSRVPATSPAANPATNPILNPDGSLNPIPQLPGLFPGLGNRPFPEYPPLPGQFPKPERDRAPINQPVTTEKKSLLSKSLGAILSPVALLFGARQLVTDYVQVKVGDPIYKKMLEDPVLGTALREAEKSNMDMEAVGTYFANYDWDNFNAEQMTKDLGVIVGAAGAARIVVFFIGRKVLFRT